MSLPSSDQVPLPVAVVYSLIFGLFVISAALWGQTLLRIAAGKRVLPTPETRRIQPWGAIDLLLAVVLFFLIQAFFVIQVFGVGNASRRDTRVPQAVGGLPEIEVSKSVEPNVVDPESDTDSTPTSQVPTSKPTAATEDRSPSLSIHCWLSLLCCYAVILTTLFIMRRCRVSEDDVGWSFSRAGYDIRLGLTVFTMAVPPIMVLMMLATKLSGIAYEHPVMEQSKKDPSLLVPAFIMAVLCAPLTEEFGFRVLLQGFLEGFSQGRRTLERFILGASVDVDHATNVRPVETNSVPWWPTVISGLIFGLAHFSYGVSWVPLVAFGIVLGGVYRITNRILPCLVVHACFNGLTMLMFSLSVIYKLPTS